MPKKNGQNKQLTESDRKQYIQRWAEFMVKFWQEKMMKFSPPVFDTGRLYHSLNGMVHEGSITTVEHNFMEYGLYVASGTGSGYRRGNSGKDDENGLQFLRGDKWKEKGHRKPRDWFTKKYLYSIHRLNDFEADYFGETYQGLISDALVAMFGDKRAVKGSKITDSQKHNLGNF